MTEVNKQSIGSTKILNELLMQKLAQDPTVSGVVGEPLPPEMIQQGAEQMTPPPGQASGMPAEGGDPMVQLLDVVGQLGAMIEQIAGPLIETLSRIAETGDRIERQVVMLTGVSVGEEAAQAANPQAAEMAQPPVPKVASDDDHLVPARGRDGVAASGDVEQFSGLRSTIEHTRNLYESIRAIQDAT